MNAIARRILAALPFIAACSGPSEPPAPPLLVRGTIVTPDTVLVDGWMLTRDGRIEAIGTADVDTTGIVEVRSDGLVFPGLVDLHNHVSYNVFRPWTPPRIYSNRYEWRSDSTHQALIGAPWRELFDDHFCDMNRYGELRALAGGTTSILATRPGKCVDGLVRNLDHASGLRSVGADADFVRNEIEIRSSTAPEMLESMKRFVDDGKSQALVVHVAERTDSLSLAEFPFMRDQGLLGDKSVLVHALALGAAEYETLADVGGSIVWSPSSNLALYGKTIDVAAALDAGVEIALAPDWAVTGSEHLLAELKVARAWLDAHAPGRVGDRELLDMATSVPARMMGLASEIGSLAPGRRADFFVIRGDQADPFGSLLRAGSGDVELVVVDGVPLYGSATPMQAVWEASTLDSIPVGTSTRWARPPRTVRWPALLDRLESALRGKGLEMAPISDSR